MNNDHAILDPRDFPLPTCPDEIQPLVRAAIQLAGDLETNVRLKTNEHERHFALSKIENVRDA